MPQLFVRWMPKLSLCRTDSRISKGVDRPFAASGGALVAEVGFDFRAGDGLHPSTFQVVITAVEHGARFDHILHKFSEIPFIVNKL